MIEALRKTVVSQLFQTSTFKGAFPIWKSRINELLGEQPSVNGILDLGSSLREIFTSTGSAGRGQESLSGGGAAWEGLICWYLNLCLIGTNSVVIKKRSQVPKAIQDALTVSYRNVGANTESDMVCITFPDCDELNVTDFNEKEMMPSFDLISDREFEKLRVTVIQSKTNWNDNAQIPMLWDMIYHANGFDDRRVTVGTNGFHLSNLKHFAYAFFTVPSNKLELFKDSSICVKRASELSGGNYWGCDSKKGVAKAPKEIFATCKIGPSEGNGVRSSLSNELPHLNSRYSYFEI